MLSPPRPLARGPRRGHLVVALAALLLPAAAAATEPPPRFDRAWGFEVAGGFGFEVCMSACQEGIIATPHLPYDVATDTTGNIYIADTGNDRIRKFSADGAYLTQWGSRGTGNGQFRNPKGVATDTEGNVYVADTENHRIQKFVPEPSAPWLAAAALGTLALLRLRRPGKQDRGSARSAQ